MSFCGACVGKCAVFRMTARRDTIVNWPPMPGPAAGLLGIEGGVVSGVINRLRV
jgi:hypothetical protein